RPASPDPRHQTSRGAAFTRAGGPLGHRLGAVRRGSTPGAARRLSVETTMDPCSAEAFEARYAADPDPWRFASSPAEMARYDAIMALLARRHYRSGYEPACSIGALT